MKQNLYWLLFLLLSFLVTLPLSWWLMAKADFFYSNLYELGGIEAHIQEFAPKNQFNKMDFEATSKAERVALFHEVVVAIQNNGKGLENLRYQNYVSGRSVVLFTKSEVRHLNDVASLLNKLQPVVIVLMALWLLLVVMIGIKKLTPPSLKQWCGYGFLLISLLVLVLLLGPERIFDQLHIWVFPAEHQWFFYYEESLMSTFMKAPDLFAYIAVIGGVLSLLLTVAVLYLVHLFLRLRR